MPSCHPFALYPLFFAIFPLLRQIIYIMLTDRKNISQHIKVFAKIGHYFFALGNFVILFQTLFWSVRLDHLLLCALTRS